MPKNELAPVESALNEIIESVITKGDLAKLSPQERTEYYIRTCRSVGLNPFTKPLEYINLNGKLTLYARRDAADQLRKINGISVEVVSRKVEDDLCIVHVKAHDKAGRTDEDFGAVTIARLSGEAKANAILKCITKAKRRVTLSISGLGFLDETEVDDISIRDAQPAQISAAADLDQFAEVPDQRHELPRSPIWQEASYRVEPNKIQFGDHEGEPNWRAWTDHIIFLISEASGDEIDKLRADNRDLLATLHRENGDLFREITEAAMSRRADLNAGATA